MTEANTGDFDGFGSSLSLSGDTLAVGSPGESSDATGVDGDQSNYGAEYSGAVYVFVRDGGTWTQQAYLKASNADAGDSFGKVSLSGDTLAVGASMEGSAETGVDGDQSNNDAGKSGAVYIFVRNGNEWTQQAYLKASNTDAGDYFGSSVSLSGDTLAVGAFAESSAAVGVDGDQSNNDASGAGAVYVFQREGTQWSQQAYLKASNTGAKDQFGRSVSLSGDSLAVGSVQEASASKGVDGDPSNDASPYSGAVYLFERTGAQWAQQAYIKASNADTYERFGYSVSLHGDRLAVGANQEDSNATGIGGDQGDETAPFSGAAYLFRRSGASWVQQAYIKASNAEAYDQFGYHVCVSEDSLAVGAIYESSAAKGVNGDQSDNAWPESGAVYVFQ